MSNNQAIPRNADARHFHAPARAAEAHSGGVGNATEWFDYGIYGYGLTYIFPLRSFPAARHR